MSTMQRLTLIGLYNYDSTLFDNVTLPTGYDKPTFINTLLLEHGEKLVLYTDLDFMKFSLGVISAKWALELEKIYDALTAEYDPTYNYDRYEKTTNSAKYDDDRTPDLTQTNTRVEPETTENKVSAFNATTYQPSDQTTVTGGVVTNAETGTDKRHVEGKLSDIDGHIYGNIGVTSTSALVTEAVGMRLKRNLYSVAAQIFANELLIGIY